MWKDTWMLKDFPECLLFRLISEKNLSHWNDSQINFSIAS